MDLLSLPTAPFHEHAIIAYVRRWAAERPRLRLTRDEYGNLRLDLRVGAVGTGRPLFFSAHMDHPGFVAVRMKRDGELAARWHGGVQPEFFERAGVRFHDGRRWVRGKVKSCEVGNVMGRRRVLTALIEVRRPVPAGSVGMWDLPEPAIRDSRVYGRSCDDLAGVAAVLSALDELIETGRSACAGALLTRAEEVGFAGAIAACRSGLVPGRARVVSVECSPLQPGVEMGAGPVVRVGDRMSVFTPGMVEWCKRVGEGVARRCDGFTFQRKLLDGGACESTAYMEYGYETTGLSLPLGNYHNMDPAAGRIAAEYVNLSDFDRLVQWMVGLMTTPMPRETGRTKLRQSFSRQLRTWGPMLKRTLTPSVPG